MQQLKFTQIQAIFMLKIALANHIIIHCNLLQLIL